MPYVYDELRRLARIFLAGERDAKTLQPTALVIEIGLLNPTKERVNNNL